MTFMDVFEKGILAEKREKYPDILLAQLLETSTEFRDWFINQTSINAEPDQHIGVRCNETKDGRETDVLFGFRDRDGDKHIVLIENKIKAKEQPSQLRDYHKRGRSYVDEGHADAFNVCLIAPEEWLSSEYVEKVDSIIQYEDIIDTLGSTNHDGAPFVREVFEECANEASSSVQDLTNVTNELWTRARNKSEKNLIERPGRKPATRKNVRCTSSHPEHPPFIVYRMFISNSENHGETSISVVIEYTQDKISNKYSSGKYELKSTFGNPIAQKLSQEHPKFSQKYEHDSDSKNTVLRHTIRHDEYSGFGTQDYYDGVIDEFSEFVDKVHPIIIDLQFEQLARSQL